MTKKCHHCKAKINTKKGEGVDWNYDGRYFGKNGHEYQALACMKCVKARRSYFWQIRVNNPSQQFIIEG